MAKTGMVTRVGVLLTASVTVIALIYIFSGDNEELIDPATIATVTNSEANLESALPQQSKQQTSPTFDTESEDATSDGKALFYLASRSCQTEVVKLFKEYRPNSALFRKIRELAYDSILDANNPPNNYQRAAIERLFAFPEPSFRGDVVNRNSAKFKMSTMDIERALRDESVAVDAEEFIKAIANKKSALAESLLRDMVADSPDKILTLQGSRMPLLYVASALARNDENPDEALKALIDIFDAAGYNFHFAEIVDLSRGFFMKRLEVLTYLADRFNGDLNTVFDVKRGAKSSNLVLEAIRFNQLELAAYWLDKGVNPFTNQDEVDSVKYSLELPIYDDNAERTKAIKKLLNAGLLTTTRNEKFEKELNDWLPEANAETYYERHQRISNLPPGQDKQLQSELARLAQAALDFHTDGAVELTAGCEDEFLKQFKKSQKRAIKRSRKNDQQDMFAELGTQGSAIYREYKDGFIDASYAIDQLSLIDEYRSQQYLDMIKYDLYSSERPSFFQRNKAGNSDSSQQSSSRSAPDPNTATQAWNAVMKGDYKLALDLTDLLEEDARNQIRNQMIIFALKADVPIDIMKRLLKDAELRVGPIIHSLLATNDMEMLRTMAAAGFDINAEDELNRSLLRIAVKDKHEKALKTLIKLGVDVEVPSIGNDALDLALVDIIKGHSDFYFVQQLLRAGKRIEDSHRQLLADILLMYPEATQKVIDKYGIVL
jgi:hypothetical protein